MFCSHCGKQIPDNAWFCSYCGKEMENQEDTKEIASESIEITDVVMETSSTNDGLFSMKRFIIDEKISLLKFANAYAIYNDAGESVGAIQQVNISGGAKAARLLLGSSAKVLQSFQLNVMDKDGNVQAVIKREGVGSGLSSLRVITIYDRNNNKIGTLDNKVLYDANGVVVGQVQFDSIIRSHFTLYDSTGKTTLARVDKQWNGIGKELFTTADKYLVEICERPDPKNKVLVLATAITVDMIYHEI